MEFKLIIGIDVSKSALDYSSITREITWPSLSKAVVKSLKNKVESIETFLKGIDADETLFVFEPTGTYSDKLMSILIRQGYRFALVSPNQSHHFCEMKGITNKDDKQAARTLAYMGLTQELPLYQVPSECMKRRKQLIAAINGLEKQKQMLRNKLHAQEQYYDPNKAIETSLKKILKAVEKELITLEEELLQTEDDTFAKAKKLATSVVGIGPVTARWLLITTDSLINFHNPRQVLKYCGLISKSHRSGTSVHKNGGITKKAHTKLRGTLFMAARSAIRYNRACKDLYLRLRARGKPYYKAMVAVMAKLVKQLFGVVKSGKMFDNDYYLKYQKNPKMLAPNA
jgi:transposase